MIISDSTYGVVFAKNMDVCKVHSTGSSMWIPGGSPYSPGFRRIINETVARKCWFAVAAESLVRK